ncbi:MAG TPA: hypothetical protein VF647_09065 [Longimicrobium sp.]|jgi:hypothetical protein
MRAVSLESLHTLRDRIASLQVTRCRMFHERVRIENGAVLRVSRGEPEPALVRIGLCSPEVRARNLACGHTMARYVLLDAVQALHAAGMLPEDVRARLQREVESVSDGIHLLDHQKGHAERHLALSTEAKQEPSQGAAEVRRLEEQHDAYAEQIRALRRTVLAHLEAALDGGRVPELTATR